MSTVSRPFWVPKGFHISKQAILSTIYRNFMIFQIWIKALKRLICEFYRIVLQSTSRTPPDLGTFNAPWLDLAEAVRTHVTNVDICADYRI